jgi:RNA polymerase sigma-70 factor (ECF subfamily)
MSGGTTSSEGRRSPDPRPTSYCLIALAQQGDPDAWRQLVAVYTPLVHWWCRCRGLREEAVDDVCQEVFRTVAAKVSGFRRLRSRGGFRSWLRRITEHKAGDQQRRARREPAAQGGSDAQLVLEQVPEAAPPGDDTSERARLCRGALDRIRAAFEPRTWQAAWQTAVEGRSPPDVADELGMSVSAVYTAKSKVLARLRAELTGLLEGTVRTD